MLDPNAPSATVIVRCKDKEATIGQTFESLRAQTIDCEIVVVDSGSTDRTLKIARRYADQVLTINSEDFSYGGALNLGAKAASGDINFALSAHCSPDSNRWLERSLSHYADDQVCATNGVTLDTSGKVVTGPIAPTPSLLLDNPRWGFSNHASSWRASVWREFPFRTDLIACEDKEWSWRVAQAGWRIVFDPDLFVGSSHRRSAGTRDLYRRVYKESFALAQLGKPASTTAAAISEWWNEMSYESKYPRWLRRASPHRIAEQIALVAGTRAGLRDR